MDGTVLLTAVRSYNTVSEFITGGGLYEAVSAVGDIETEAAKLALRNVNQAKDPKREIELAVGHLQSAHVAYEKLWRKRNTLIGRSTRGVTFLSAMHKDQWVCCLMAVCYIYLYEPSLAQKALSFAKTAQRVNNNYSGDDSNFGILKSLGQGFLSMVNPVEAAELFWGEDTPIIYDEDWPKFVKAIESYK